MIVASQKRPLGGRELQLPSMSMLTSKTSTQKFFLRVLQVIIQLRDDTRRANKKAKQTGRLGTRTEDLASICPELPTGLETGRESWGEAASGRRGAGKPTVPSAQSSARDTKPGKKV